MSDDLRSLELDLDKAAREKPEEVRRIIQRGALAIKREMQAEASRFVRGGSSLPREISYETELTATSITAEIGPVTGDVGSLALLYYGNSKTAPVLKDPVFALEREAQVVEEYIDKLVEGLL